MSNLKKFAISCEYFGGYNETIDIDNFDSLEEIINHIKENIRNLITENNFESLLIKLENLNFHTHDYSFVDVLLNTDPNKIYYICTHC